ncbi:MAG: RNA polymerase sigma factor [Planctomycetota bacterium]
MIQPLDPHEEARLRAYVRHLARSVAKGDVHLADDLEQATLLVALQARPRDPRSLRAWLYSVCINTLRRDVGRDRVVREPVDEDAWTEDEDPLDLVLDDEMRVVLRSAIRRLPSSQGQAIELRFLRGLSAVEVATELGVPVETARTRVKRGLNALRSDLDGSEVAEWRRRIAAPLGLGLGEIVRRLRTPVLVAAAGIAAWYGLGTLGDRAPVEPTEVASARATDETVGDPAAVEAGPRTPVPQTASVRLHASNDLVARWSRGTFVELVGPEGATHVAHVARGVEGELTGLTPGLYAARISGVAVDERVLEAGTQDWELAWDRAQVVDVRVVDERGAPAAGADIFERVPGTARPSHLGTTGHDGRVTVTSSSRESWLAARGVPGAASDGAPIQLASSWDGDAVTLELLERPVHWIAIEAPDAPDLAGTFARWRRRGEPDAISIDWGRGLRDRATWLPPWRSADGAHGFAEQDTAWRIELVRDDGAVAWTSALVDAGAAPPSRIQVDPLVTLSATIVDGDGAGIPHLATGLFLRSDVRRSIARTRTDERGKFTISHRWSGERACFQVVEDGTPWFSRENMPPLDEQGRIQFDTFVADLAEVERWDFAVVGADGPVTCVAIPSTRGHVSPLGDADDLWDSEPVLAVPDDGRLSVAGYHGSVVGFRFVSAGATPDDPPIERTIALTERLRGLETVEVDLGASPTTTVVGRVDPEALPCSVFVQGAIHRQTVPVSVDPRTGEFSVSSLAPGRWSAFALDHRGRLCISGHPVQCDEGQTQDIGTVVIPPSGSLRVVFPLAPSGEPLAQGELRAFSGHTQFGRRAISATDLARGWIDIEAPASRISVKFMSRGRVYLGDANVTKGERAECELAADHLRVEFLLPADLLEHFPDTRLEMFDREDFLIFAAEGDELARLGAPHVSFVSPWVPWMRFVLTLDEATRTGEYTTEEHTTWIQVSLSTPSDDPELHAELARRRAK